MMCCSDSLLVTYHNIKQRHIGTRTLTGKQLASLNYNLTNSFKQILLIHGLLTMLGRIA
jgi:hypothetical protein